MAKASGCGFPIHPAVLQELASKLASNWSKLDCEETPKSGGTKRSLRTRPDHRQQRLAPDVNQVNSMHVSDTATAEQQLTRPQSPVRMS